MKQTQKQSARAWRTGIGRRALSLLCAGALACTGMLPLTLGARAQAEPPRLSNLILDRVYELQPVGDYPEGVMPNDTGFAPQITNYTGTAYASVNSVQVYPFAASDTATVTVNGETPNAKGYVEMDVAQPGDHLLKVQVSDGGATSIYNVTIKKTESDYRGRVPVVENEKINSELLVKTDLGNQEKLLEILKKKDVVNLPKSSKADGSYVDTQESYWSVPGDKLPDSTGEKAPVTLFTVDLGATYSVSRIRAAFGPSNLGLGKNKARISVSTDGEHWQTPVTKGNMNTGVQFHQNVTRYEFGVSYDARYIRFEVTHWQYPNKDLRLYQFMIFTDSGKVPQKQSAPEGGSVPYQHEIRHQYLSSGQATVVERGLPMLGWTPSSGYGRGTPTVEESKQFGYDGPLFYDPDFSNADYMLYNPDSMWGIAKAPFGGNNMSNAGEPKEFVPESMKPYINNAISFCFGDEGNYNRGEAEAFGKWFAWTRQHYPGVILHTNQFPGQWGETNVKEYLRIAQPDLLTWDDYYGDRGWANPSSIDLSKADVQKNAARRLLNLPTWESYRKLAYGGVDGTGSMPIMFGQYLDAFAFNHSQSNKNLVVNTSILSGMKWLNFFRVEYQFDRSYLWDEDGTPTRGLLEWGQLIDRVHAIDDQLTRLNNDWIMFKVGQIGSENGASAGGFRRGNFDSEQSAAKNREFGLSAVQAKSLSKAHGGQTGDVVLGYFNTLPGLYENEIAKYFAGATAPKAFMVMNGLVAGIAERYNQFNIPQREVGSSENTRQQITLTADPAFVQAGYTLYEVQKDNGGALCPVQLDESGSFTVTLGGGEANLYFWNTNTTASASSQTEGAYASFAFDSHPATYWQPEQTAETYTLENTFDQSLADQLTVVEKGSAIETMTAEYLDISGQWQPLGQLSKNEGVWTLTAGNAVETAGIRLTITGADLPAIYEVQMNRTALDPNRVNTITVNDNTMGSGLFRFDYDGLWSYRETETNGESMTQYPLENDGHFSNWNGARATFTFYGNKVELLLRADQAEGIRAAITDDDSEPQWKTGTDKNRSLVFDDLKQGVHTLTIEKIDKNAQAGIDGAKVFYQGSLPADIAATNSTKPDAVQEYLDQRVIDTAEKNHFVYHPENPVSKPMGNDNNGFKLDDAEQDGWVEHVQNAQYHNLGFTRTTKEDASYSIQFYGTGVQLYAGVTPLGEANPSAKYGALTFTLDGKEVQATPLDTGKLGENGKVSARMWSIAVPDAKQNENHRLTVSAKEGYSRIDYAVVERMWENEPVAEGFAVNVVASENGKADLLTASRVQAGGNAVIEITPNEGYQPYRIVVNGAAQNIPADNRLVLTNIQQNMNVQVTFAPAAYEIQLIPGEGGVLVPSTFKAGAESAVTVKAQAFTGYRLQQDSLKATAADGSVLTMEKVENDAMRFTMPSQTVRLSAAFDKEQYSVTLAEGITGGSLELSAQGNASYRQQITVTVHPQEGMRLIDGSLKAVLADGSTLALDPIDSQCYEFTMPAQAVSLQAAFEAIPNHAVTVETAGAGTAQTVTAAVHEGGAAQVQMQPEEGNIVGKITVNGQPWPVPAQGNELTIENVTSDLALVVEFVNDQTAMHTVTITAAEGGTASPATQLVQDGSCAVVIARPEKGYEVSSVQAGEQSAEHNTANDTYLLNAVTGNQSVQVSFAKVQHTITVVQPEHGTLTVSSTAAGFGDFVTVTVQPAEGYRFEDGSLRVTGESGAQQSVQQAENGYTFRMPAETVQVSGTFMKMDAPAPGPDLQPDPEPTLKPEQSPVPTQAPDGNPKPDPTAVPTTAPKTDETPAAPAPAATSVPVAVPATDTASVRKKQKKNEMPVSESQGQTVQSSEVQPTAEPSQVTDSSQSQPVSSEASAPIVVEDADSKPMPVILATGGGVLLVAVVGIVALKLRIGNEK